MNQEYNQEFGEPQNSGNNETQEQGVEQELKNKHEVSKNIIIISVLAVIVVVLALMFMWGTSVQNKTVLENTTEAPETPSQLENQDATIRISTSDEIVEIENDLNNTEIDTLDADLEALEAEIDRALSDEEL